MIKRFQHDCGNYQLALEVEKENSLDECSNPVSKRNLKEKVYSAETGEGSYNSTLRDRNDDDPQFQMKCINQDKEFRGRDFAFDEWLRKRLGTTNIDKKTKLKVFVEWMIDGHSDESDTLDGDNDPFNRSFGKFKMEFEREVL